MQPVFLLDDSLSVEVFYSCEDADLQDNICLKISESCPNEERIFRHHENHLYLTREQALALADALVKAVKRGVEG